MNGTRMVVFVLGIALVIVGAWMLFVQTGADRWVPLGVAGAGLIVLIGLMVVGFSENATSERKVVHEERVVDDRYHR